MDKWTKLATQEVIEKTIKSLKNRGISVELVANKNAALKLLKNKIPAGAELMTGGSTTLEEIGLRFKLTRERIRQIKEKALTQLYHRAKDLKKYLE